MCSCRWSENRGEKSLARILLILKSFDSFGMRTSTERMNGIDEIEVFFCLVRQRSDAV